MAKAASPIRLQQDLMDNAIVEGQLFNRSATEQVEYWADIGRKVSRIIDPEILLAVEAGLARITVEKVESVNVNPESVFAAIDADRESGELASAIAEQSPIRYQASKTNPGLLERVGSGGDVVLGQFVNGDFIPSES